MSELSLIVEPGQDLSEILANLPEHAVVGLSPGTYTGNYKLDRSVVLKGLGLPSEVVLDARAESRVLTVEAKGIEVLVEGVTLTGGRAEAGGAVSLKGLSTITLVHCILCNNQGYRLGGGAIYARIGTLALSRCRVSDNEAPGGTAIRADQVVHMDIRDSLIVGSCERTPGLLTVLEGAQVSLSHVTLVAEGGPCITLAGTTSRHPSIEVSDSILAGAPALVNDSHLPGLVRINRTLFSRQPRGDIEDLGGNGTGDPLFLGEGPEPYRPSPLSPAAGLALGGGRDLLGTERQEDRASAGAFEV